MPDVPKDIPELTLDNLLPPNRSHVFFENSDRHSFQYNSNKFEMLNAWWLAEASLLVYDEENFVMNKFQSAGLPMFMSFNGRSTQCFVASNENFTIVAFRGTQVLRPDAKADLSGIFADVLIGGNVILVDSGQGGYVHQGFKNALDEVWEDRDGQEGLKTYLNRIKNVGDNKRTLWFTGHSLGAALATLAADRYGSVQGLYTFGSPRVGDSQFKDDFYVNTYRFVNNNDIFPNVPLIGTYPPLRIPPVGMYCHVEGLKYIHGQGRVNDNPKQTDVLRDRFASNFGHMFNVLGHIRAGFLGEISVDSFVDHAPLLYAIHIWNNYLEEISHITT